MATALVVRVGLSNTLLWLWPAEAESCLPPIMSEDVVAAVPRLLEATLGVAAFRVVRHIEARADESVERRHERPWHDPEVVCYTVETLPCLGLTATAAGI